MKTSNSGPVIVKLTVMKSRHQIWILFLGIIVAIVCFFHSVGPVQDYGNLGNLKLDVAKQEQLNFRTYLK